MIEKVFLFSFTFFIALYVIVNFYIMVLLSEKGKDVKFFDYDFTNYKSLKELSNDDKTYMRLYKFFIICTFIPIVIFFSFFIYTIVIF